MWVRGLKLKQASYKRRLYNVAPHVGAWIETKMFGCTPIQLNRRTPCGCVD